MKHLGLKITAFLFAIALWLYVMSLNTFQITMDVPVRLVKLPEMLAIASKPPQAITITVEGEAFDLMRMRSRINRGDSSVASIVVDLQDAELGASRKHIYARNFVAPSFPNIKFIEPDNQLLFIDIELDTRIERDIPVHSNVTFNTASGYLLSDEPTLSPNFVTVSGARNALTRIFEIPTDSIHFDTLKKSQSISVPLNFSQFPAYVTPSDSSIFINVNVQKVATKEFTSIPVHLIGRYDKSLVSLKPDSVTVWASQEILDTMTAAYTVPVYATSLTASQEREVALQPVRGIKYAPDQVKVNIEVDEMTENEVDVPVRGTNFPASKRLRTFPSKVKVTFQVGTKSYRSITASWFHNSPVRDLFKELAKTDARIIVTTDHGSIRVNNPIKVIGDKNTNTNLRYKLGKNLSYNPKQVFELKAPKAASLPSPNISTTYIFAQNDDFFAYPNNYNYYVNYYKNTFQHGGISMEEMLVPLVMMKSKRRG